MDCRYCKYLKFKKTTKTETQYGYCAEKDMPMISVSTECEYFEETEGIRE